MTTQPAPQIDVSGWYAVDASPAYTDPFHLYRANYGPIGKFSRKDQRDACLHAVRSIGPLGKERDEAIAAATASNNVAGGYARQLGLVIIERDKAIAERDAAVERGKVLAQGLREACSMLKSVDASCDGDDPELTASWHRSVEQIRSILQQGKEG